MHFYLFIFIFIFFFPEQSNHFLGNVSLHGEGSVVAMCWGVESKSGSGKRCL